MTDARALLQRAEAAAAQGRASESLRLTEEAVDAAESPRLKFDALLQRARAEVAAGQPAKALDTYWEARHVTKRHRLGRAGEADLGIGMMMLDLGRPGEGLEAVRRAARYFRKAGSTFLRGCAETVLADEALKSGDLSIAQRHLEVATDLLEAANEPRMVSAALTLRAEALARLGRSHEAGTLLARAEQVAQRVANPEIQAELKQRRADVRELLGPPSAS